MTVTCVYIVTNIVYKVINIVYSKEVLLQRRDLLRRPDQMACDMEVNHRRDFSPGPVVWAQFAGTGKIPWPCILQEKDEKDKYLVYCRSDEAILSTRNILPFVEIDMWKIKAKQLLRKKPQTLDLWLKDVQWAEKAVSESKRPSMCPKQLEAQNNDEDDYGLESEEDPMEREDTKAADNNNVKVSFSDDNVPKSMEDMEGEDTKAANDNVKVSFSNDDVPKSEEDMEGEDTKAADDNVKVSFSDDNVPKSEEDMEGEDTKAADNNVKVSFSDDNVPKSEEDMEGKDTKAANDNVKVSFSDDDVPKSEEDMEGEDTKAANDNVKVSFSDDDVPNSEEDMEGEDTKAANDNVKVSFSDDDVPKSEEDMEGEDTKAADNNVKVSFSDDDVPKSEEDMEGEDTKAADNNVKVSFSDDDVPKSEEDMEGEDTKAADNNVKDSFSDDDVPKSEEDMEGEDTKAADNNVKDSFSDDDVPKSEEDMEGKDTKAADYNVKDSFSDDDVPKSEEDMEGKDTKAADNNVKDSFSDDDVPKSEEDMEGEDTKAADNNVKVSCSDDDIPKSEEDMEGEDTKAADNNVKVSFSDDDVPKSEEDMEGEDTKAADNNVKDSFSDDDVPKSEEDMEGEDTKAADNNVKDSFSDDDVPKSEEDMEGKDTKAADYNVKDSFSDDDVPKSEEDMEGKDTKAADNNVKDSFSDDDVPKSEEDMEGEDTKAADNNVKVSCSDDDIPKSEENMEGKDTKAADNNVKVSFSDDDVPKSMEDMEGEDTKAADNNVKASFSDDGGQDDDDDYVLENEEDVEGEDTKAADNNDVEVSFSDDSGQDDDDDDYVPKSEEDVEGEDKKTDNNDVEVSFSVDNVPKSAEDMEGEDTKTDDTDVKVSFSDDGGQDDDDDDYVPESEEDMEGEDTKATDHDENVIIMTLDGNDVDASLSDNYSEDKNMDTVSCSHDLVDDSLIERDEKNPKIYVRKTLLSKVSPTGRKKATERVWNNYHCCFLCKRLSTNIVKHLLTHDNKETLELKSLKESKNEEHKAKARAMQTILRNKGDHEHNVLVKNVGGELIIARKSGSFNLEDYGPCPKCLEWIKLESYSTRHQSVCPAVSKAGGHGKKMTKGEAIVQSAAVMGDLSEVASKKLIAEVYPIMTRDEVTDCSKNDPLIVALGNNWFKRNMGNKLKRKYYTSSRMRGAARLLQHLRALTRTNLTMNDFLVPAYFNCMCEATLLCAHMENDDEEDLKSPSAALKIGFDIGRMSSLKLGIALRSGNHVQKKEADEFSTLMKLEWSTRVSRMAHLKLRLEKTNKPQKSLPIPEDLSVLGGRVISELKDMDLAATGSQNFETYRRCVMLLETRLMTYNKRRSGELEALSLENYRSRSKGLDEADRALFGNDLTDVEKYLVESQELIKIRGKNGKIVPILVPEDARKAMEFITSTNVRRRVGIKTWNNYVFANTGDGVIRAYDSLKAICGELSLTAPDRITSVSMRKYIATLSQVIDMKDFELEWLCNHLGHTASIHKLHYRSTSGFIERVNIGKLMILQDLNMAGKFSGKRLQDIDLTDLVNCNKEATGETVVVPEEEEDCADEDFLDDGDEPHKHKVRKTSTRQTWSKEEEHELHQLLSENFKSKKLPRMKECLTAIGKSRSKGGILHKRNWETIKKKAIRMIKKL